MDMSMAGVPVALRDDPTKVGLLVGTQVVAGQPSKASLALPDGKQQSNLTAICVVAIPGKFVVIPIDLLIPLVNIESSQRKSSSAEPEMR